MSQIEELQGRIAAAMARIDAGVSVIAGRAQDQAEAPDLADALEEERRANARLEDQLRALQAQHEDDIAQLRTEFDRTAEIDGLNAQLLTLDQALGQLDMDLQRLREANEQLRASNGALRSANENGVGEPELINRALEAEIEGLRAVHATELAEVGAVLAKLKPLLADVDGLPEGEDA